MALAKLALPLVSISGSIGSNVFSSDNSGLHLCAPKRVVGNSTPSQVKVQNAFLSSLVAWHFLDAFPDVRSSWSAFATFPETGYNAFLRVNWYQFFNGERALLIPPFELG